MTQQLIAQDGATVSRFSAGTSLFQTLTDAATVNWDLALGSGQVTLGGSRTLANPTNLAAGFYALKITQDGGGLRTLTYGGAYKFIGGVSPTLSVTGGYSDLLVFYCDGTNLWLASFGAHLA